MMDACNYLSESGIERIAREATRASLVGHKRLTKDETARLTRGLIRKDDTYEYELYLVGECPEDAIVLTRTIVGRVSGKADVEVFLPRLGE